MSKFTVRVELCNATEDDYEKLRVEMEERGFSRLIPGGDGGKYLLPTAEYCLDAGWTPDPVAGDVGDPQSLNRYAYVLNNPTNLTDPLGLDPWDPFAPGGGGAGGGGFSWGTPGTLQVFCPRGCSYFPDGLSIMIGPPFGDTRPAFDWGWGSSWAAGEYKVPIYPMSLWDLLAPMGSRSCDPFGSCGGPTVYRLTGTGRSALDKLAIHLARLPGLGRAMARLIPKGYYWNPIDQLVNKHHPGEWSFRQTFGTVCSSHKTVDQITETEKQHIDTVNPVPGWPLLISPAAAGIVWGASAPAHYIFDVKGKLPESDVCP